MIQKREVTSYFIGSFIVAVLFSLIIAVLSPRLTVFEKPADQGAWWYYWQLANPTLLTRISAWGLYILHQVFVWVLAARMLKEGNHPDSMSRVNKIALWGNLLFMALHLIQTHIFYDGIAQDVPVWSSQWSVIIMLVIIIYLLIPRRGIIFGVKMPIQEKLYQWIRKYHGFYISWALVYTFWFHPMEGDYGIVTGFFYMFLLFMQLSFAGTKIHYAIGWITVLELTVGLHGPAISLQKFLAEKAGFSIFADTWPMFLFGFVAVFVFTGQYGFKLSRITRVGIFTVYAALAFIVYYFRGYNRLFEISFIPVALIGGAALLAVVGNILSGRQNKIHAQTQSS